MAPSLGCYLRGQPDRAVPILSRELNPSHLQDNPEALDPYDPLSFGFVEVGYIWKPHGLKGEVKVRTVSDFGAERLCEPGPAVVPSLREGSRWDMAHGAYCA